MKMRVRRIWVLDEDARLLKALSLKRQMPMYKVLSEKLRENEGDVDFRFSF